MKQIFCLAIIFISLSLSGQNNIKFYTEKADKYLDKERSLSTFYSIEKNGIHTYASAKDRQAGISEFFIDWKHLESFKSEFHNADPKKVFEIYKSGAYHGDAPDKKNNKQLSDTINKQGTKPLEGLRIALDPGHIANDHESGDLEKKHIRFKQDVLHGIADSVEISEGMLTYATAILLKKKLEADGAEIMITRSKGTTAFGKTYTEWKKDELRKAIDSLYKEGELKPSQKQYFLSEKAQDRDIFRVIFRDLDLAKRAELINNFGPDLTVIIHYNVDETNAEWLHPTKRDFNMAFVGGAFMKNDLTSPEKRFEFLRLLITDDLERSIALSTAVVNAFEKKLDVPITGEQDAKYIGQSCLGTERKGVYCRNLQLTRYIHSPLVYGETLYQDNIKESQLLNKENDKTRNERVQQVAEAYYEGILEFVKAERK